LLLPPFIRASLNFFTLTFRALGRNHIASTTATGFYDALCIISVLLLQSSVTHDPSEIYLGIYLVNVFMCMSSYRINWAHNYFFHYAHF